MKYKKLMILAIFLVSLLAISAVNAADNATSDVVSVEETTDQVVSVENDNQVITEGNDSEVGSFADLETEINNVEEGGVLNLTKDYKYVNGSTDGICISKTITIDGQGHTIDGNYASKIFYVYADTVVIKNISFINALINSNGGAITWQANNGVLNSCDFVNCSNVIGSRKDSYSGGAICLIGNNMNISYCNFINNSAKYRSGAISISGDNHKILNCNFINNTAENMAGAIECYGDLISITNCNFLGNVANQCGALMLDGEKIIIDYCNFTNNHAELKAAIEFVSLYDAYINNCIFTNNFADDWGAVGKVDCCENCWFNNCNFINNQGTELLTVISSTNVTFNYCLFDHDYGNIASYSSEVNIIKQNSKINAYFVVNSSSFRYGNVSIFHVSLTDDLGNLSNKNIIVYLENNKELKTFNLITDEFGVINALQEFRDLTVGTWNVTVIFEGNDNYAPCNATATITVLPPSSSVTISDVNATVGQEVSLVANVNSTLTVNEGIVSFFDGENSIGDANVYGGVATLTYTPSAAGEHTITASFNSDNYGSSNDTELLTVSKADVDLSIDYITDVYFTNPSNFAVNVNSNYKPVNEGKVKYYVNNELVGTVDVYGGNANFNYVTGTAGSFTLTAAYEETDNYFAKNASASFNVNKMPTTLSGESVIFDEESYKTFTTELKDNNNNGVGDQPIKIEVIKYSGESATFNGISDSNGITVYDVGRLAGGMWYVTGIYAGDKNYIKSSFVDKFIVVKMNTTTDIEEISNPKINHNYKLKANIHDEDGKLVKEGIVQFFLDGVDIGSIDLSNNQGHQSALGEGVLGVVDSMFEYELGAENDVYINYVPTKAGKHTLTAVYEGTTLYRSSNSTTILDVSNSNKNGVTITAPTVNTVFNGGKYLVVTLNDAGTGKAISGANVKVVLNGKTSNPTTNKNGQVKISINGLAPKNYTAKITFAGNTKYDKLSDSAKVVVTKATPKITAKAKTFKKSDKTKKYTVTLKNNKKLIKGVTVKITVNKKTYSAKTSSKGVATFKLTKLTKKGKFTATVKSVANKYYNAKTLKNIKITVK